MKIYLVQHAVAKSEDEDPNRPLTEAGILDAEKIGAFIGQMDLNLEGIFYSEKLRAKQTALIMSKYLKTEFGCHETDTLCANDDIQVWIMRCLCADGNPMLVGHMPHLNKMLSRLVSGDEEKQVLNFHNAGVVCIEGDEETEDFNVKWVILPEMLT